MTQKEKETETEIWKDVIGYEGIYQVSDLGNVKALFRLDTAGHRLKEKIMKLHPHNHGYMTVRLTKDGISKNQYVHRLMCFAFLENKENKKTVNHKNGIKNDNNLDNLEWCTQSENMLHAINTGLSSSVGETHVDSKLSNIDVGNIKHLLISGETATQIKRKYFPHVCRQTICNIKHQRSWVKIKANSRFIN